MGTAIGEHGMIGDTRTRGFVDGEAVLRRIGWEARSTLPRSVDAAGWPDGLSAIELDGARRVAQSYRAGTTILDTYFSGPEGALKLTDFMPVETPSVDTLAAGHDARTVLARVVRFLTGTRGSLCGTLTFARPVGGASMHRQGPAAWSIDQDPLVIHIEGAQGLTQDAQGLHMAFALKAGEQAHLAITCACTEPAFPGTSLSAARKALAQCDAYWRSGDHSA
ncbi:hypothetical protein MTR62_01835 [Novosphingobium sp. 1949]|uniref:Uncharacterized protein n=1 Tax=Novosphingobium organovorum TaxID=2930092 RepID=A0ABT0B8U8_9SPHN|nr:hypothetical protein [Novosphingobium organovorum]MCJ2181453.1 hypothetical protein [Novosphingobium organovorum]